jgi:glycosyltransferase involved in cell wall biosynthesis
MAATGTAGQRAPPSPACCRFFIALSEFARDRFIAGGLPADKVAIKPNFVDSDPGIGSGRGNFALFVGRLVEEKGIGTLLAAWSRLSVKPKLKIIGDGPLAPAVANAAAAIREIEWLGPRSKEEVTGAMAEASVLILPSTWYEGFPLVIAEAFAAGLPIIASRIGGLAEVVSDGQTGWLVSPGDPDELSSAVSRIFSRPQELQAMRRTTHSSSISMKLRLEVARWRSGFGSQQRSSGISRASNLRNQGFFGLLIVHIRKVHAGIAAPSGSKAIG